jgi:hypothetical protein
MSRILKFPTTIKPVRSQDYPDEQRYEVGMPKGADIINIDWQDNVLCIWAIMHRDGDHLLYENRHFKIVRTGEKFSECQLAYICTTHRGNFVGHIFEEYR